MERYNKDGKFNVPFGHYQKMGCNLSPDHHRFLRDNATIKSEDAIDIINECNEDDWIFLDPPYLDRLGYTTGDGGDDLHTRLVEAMKTTKAKWLFIHSDCDFYRIIYPSLTFRPKHSDILKTLVRERITLVRR